MISISTKFCREDDGDEEDRVLLERPLSFAEMKKRILEKISAEEREAASSGHTTNSRRMSVIIETPAVPSLLFDMITTDRNKLRSPSVLR